MKKLAIDAALCVTALLVAISAGDAQADCECVASIYAVCHDGEDDCSPPTTVGKYSPEDGIEIYSGTYEITPDTAYYCQVSCNINGAVDTVTVKIDANHPCIGTLEYRGSLDCGPIQKDIISGGDFTNTPSTLPYVE